jgi:hypothetical protein
MARSVTKTVTVASTAAFPGQQPRRVHNGESGTCRAMVPKDGWQCSKPATCAIRAPGNPATDGKTLCTGHGEAWLRGSAMTLTTET